MKQIINLDEETNKKLREYVYNKKSKGEIVTISSFVRDCVNKTITESK